MNHVLLTVAVLSSLSTLAVAVLARRWLKRWSTSPRMTARRLARMHDQTVEGIEEMGSEKGGFREADAR